MGGYYLPFYGNVRGSTKVPALTKEIEMEKKSSAISDVYNFVKDHWGEVYFVIDTASNMLGKQLPIKKDGKVDYGGFGKLTDEITVDRVEQLLSPDDQKSLVLWRRSLDNRFGNGLTGRFFKAFYLNKSRLLIMHMIDLPKTTEEGKGEDSPEIYTKAKEHLEKVAAHMRFGIRECKGTEDEKLEAGRQQVCAFLDSKSFPTPTFINVAKPLDEFVGKLPRQGLKMAGESATKLETAYHQRMDRRREELQEKPWWRRLL